MYNRTRLTVFLVLLWWTLALPAPAALVSPQALQNWPQWRGPLATGAAPTANPPLTWSATENIRWKVAVPGSGTATPVVWGQRVFILTAVPTGNNPLAATEGQSRLSTGKPTQPYQFLVLCYDRQTGHLLWQQIAREEIPHEGHHPDHGYASASPVTDGEHLFAYFGSRGLHCFDVEGNKTWSRDFGKMQTRNSFGEGSSPALYEDKIILYRDDETDSDAVFALDKKTGKEVWKTPRNEPTGWSTPLIVEHQGRAQAIINATGFVRSYDLETGAELWRCSGQTANPIPSPVADSDTVYVTSGFRGSALYAIAFSRKGDLSGTDAVCWSRQKNTPYASSPLLADNFLYTVTVNNGVLSCWDSKTGQPFFEGEKLDGITGIYASPVAAHGRVYVLGRNGLCLVLKQGPKLEVLARNDLGEKTDASPALVGTELFIRSHEHLFCISAGNK